MVLGLPVAGAVLRLFPRLRGRRTQVALLLCFVTAVGLVALAGYERSPSRPDRDWLSPPRDYRAAVYALENAGGPVGDHHHGLDELVAWMGSHDLKFYRSETVGPESGPDGIVGADDLVLIKISSQWPERGGTNTDVLKGLIARVVEHPDGFVGEVVVGENTQTWGSLDWEFSNAEDHSQSTQDVVDHFAGLGRPVSTSFWDDFQATMVSEYDEGDMQDGYIVDEWNPETRICVSYPKFQTAQGQYLSLRHGIWDPVGETYDDSRFTFLNVPILKCHGYQYGVTAACKHHVGTMTTALATNTHFAVATGGLGNFLAEVRMPDLNILDCIYVLAHPDAGPWCTYEEATRVDKLAASLDPVALDLWTTVNILVPALLENGYTEYPMQDPDDPGSIFRIYLDVTTDVMLAAGLEVTNDLAQIDAYVYESAEVEPLMEPAWTAQALPNPTSAGASIRHTLPQASAATLEVYDAAGRRVWWSEQAATGGVPVEIYWDGRDLAGRRVPAGAYHYRLRAGSEAVGGKLLVIR